MGVFTKSDFLHRYFLTFIITSVEQLFAKDLLFRALLGSGFIIVVVAHINNRNLNEDLRDHGFMTSAHKESG